MTSRSIMVTETDMDRLNRLVRDLRQSLFRDQQQLESLDQTLASAEVRPADQVPGDVVRINSYVRVLDLGTRKRGLYRLVFPEFADISRNLVSVLAPLGIALLGREQGELIAAKVPAGTRRLRLERVLSRVRIRRTPCAPVLVPAPRSFPGQSEELAAA